MSAKKQLQPTARDIGTARAGFQGDLTKPVLVFDSGYLSDQLLEQSLTDHESYGACVPVLVARIRVGNPNRYDMCIHEHGYRSQSLRPGATLSGVAEAASALGVRWIAPTVHAPNEVDVAVVARALGIPHVSVEVVSTCSVKTMLGDVCNAAGLYQPQSFRCESRSEILEALAEVHRPAFIKPLEGWGSLGARRTDSAKGITADVESAVDWHLERRGRWNLSTTIVQEFVEGIEFGGIAAVENGKIVFFMTTRKEMTSGLYRKEVGHVWDLNDPLRKIHEPGIRSDIARLVNELHHLDPTQPGMKRCFFNWDMLVTREGNRFVADASPRLGGWLTQLADVSLGAKPGHFLRQAVAWAHGNEVRFTPIGRPKAGLVRTGVVNGGFVTRSVYDSPGLPESCFLAIETSFGLKGKPLAPLTTLEDTDGHPIIGVSGKTIREAEHNYEAVLASFGLEVSPVCTERNSLAMAIG